MTNISVKILDAWKSNEAAYEVAHALRSQQLNTHVYAVGGVVRDAILGVESNDVDLLVTGWNPADLEFVLAGLTGWTDITGKHFGVFRYKVSDSEVEIALPRTDRSTGPEHTDFHATVNPWLPLEHDLARRDFTCNSMAFNLFNHTLSDPFDGVNDTQGGLIRVLHEKSFEDDPLRLMRALVLKARFGFEPTIATFASMMNHADKLNSIKAERIQWELDKIFEANDPAGAMDWAIATLLINQFFPEFEASLYYDQNNPHHDNLLHIHALNVLRYICERTNDKDLRLAAFLHDIGKPYSAWIDPVTGSNHFYKKRFNANDITPDKFDKVEWVNLAEFDVGKQHELEGATINAMIMSRLKYPMKRIQRVHHLTAYHMWAPFTSLKGARRFLNNYGDYADDLMALRWADQGGKSIYPATPEHSLITQINLLDEVRREEQPTKQSDLAINGHDLIEAGFEPGPLMGKILAQLTDDVIENPEWNDKDYLIKAAKTYEREPDGS